MQRIVTIGGGSGQYGILSGLMDYSLSHPSELKQEDISAIVTTFDTGGHTGLLIEARRPVDVHGNYLPPGDIRQCLAALANNKEIKKLFEMRTRDGHNKGHNLGNTILDALFEEYKNDFEKAIEAARKVLDVKGNVYPCTLKRAHFYGVLGNGYRIDKENMLVERSILFKSPIKKVYIEPKNIKANPMAIKAIEEADKIVFSQGSIYTSLIPNIAVKEIAETIKKSRGQKIYVMNIVTQRGETDGFTAKDHVKTLEDYLGRGTIEKVIMHSGRLPRTLENKYKKEGQEKVKDDLNGSRKLVRANLVTRGSPVLRHDPDKLAEVIIRL